MRRIVYGLLRKTMLPLEYVKFILDNLQEMSYANVLLLYDALREERVEGAKFLCEIDHEDCTGGEDYDSCYKVYDVGGDIFGIARVKSERKMVDEIGDWLRCDEIRIVDIAEKTVEVKKYEVVEEMEEQENE